MRQLFKDLSLLPQRCYQVHKLLFLCILFVCSPAQAKAEQTPVSLQSNQTAIQLQNNVAVHNLSGNIHAMPDNVAGSNLVLSGNTHDMLYYYSSIPTGVASLTIRTWGGTGDADLYVRYGSEATPDSYEYSSTLSGNTESVTINNPQAGDWYFTVYAYTAFSGLNIEVSYSYPSPWALFLPAILAKHQNTPPPVVPPPVVPPPVVYDDIQGDWTVYYDEGCSGHPTKILLSIIEMNSYYFGNFGVNISEVGNWSLDGDQLTLQPTWTDGNSNTPPASDYKYYTVNPTYNYFHSNTGCTTGSR